MAIRYPASIPASHRPGFTARRALPPGWTIDGTELYQNASRGGRPSGSPQRLRMLIERARQANLGRSD